MAVAAAAESVTRESELQVRVVAVKGIAFMASGPRPAFRENSSAVMRWGTDIPSPMNRKTYLGVAANTLAVAAHTAAKIRTFMFFISAVYYTINRRRNTA